MPTLEDGGEFHDSQMYNKIHKKSWETITRCINDAPRRYIDDAPVMEKCPKCGQLKQKNGAS